VSVGVRIGARFVGFRDGKNFGSLPVGGKISQPQELLEYSSYYGILQLLIMYMD
jgi:dipeptide/tripeptide permease